MSDAIRLDPAVALPTTDRHAGPATVPETGFRALLERLQQLAAARATEPPVTDAEGLRDAVAEAEHSFATAMDLRRQLEDAFRRHLP